MVSAAPAIVRGGRSSGLHISTNGRTFAALLERLVAERPAPVEELLILACPLRPPASRSRPTLPFMTGVDPPGGEPGSRADDCSSRALVPARAERRGRLAFVLLFFLAVGLAAYTVWPFRAPLFLAAVLSSVLRRPYVRLARLLGGRSATAALLATLGVLILLVGPLGIIVGFAAGEIVKGLLFVRDQLGLQSVEQLRQGSLPPRAAVLVDRALAAFHVSREQLGDHLRDAATAAEHGAQRLAAHSGTALLDVGVLLIALYFFFVEGSALAGWLARVSPLPARQTRDLFAEFRHVTRAAVLGAAITAGFQACIATLGYVITGVPHAFFFGVVTLFAAFLPVVGTVLVWVPAALFLWFSAHHVAALVLLVYCMVFVVGAEHVGKPIVLRAILGGRGEMHTGVVFLALLGGVTMFGLLGIILGPLIFAFFLAMVRIYERDFAGQGVNEGRC